MHIYTIGFAAVLLSLSGPGAQIKESIIDAILPRQSDPQGCGYAVAAALINFVKTAICLADIQKGSASPTFSLEKIQIAASLMHSYGKTPPLSLADLEKLLSMEGISSTPFRVPKDESLKLIAGAALPVVVHIGGPYPHFLLGLGGDEEHILFFDPGSGLVALTHEESIALISGYFLIPEKTIAARPLEDYEKAFRKLKQLIWNVYWDCAQN
ncbi:MAG: cysteine peptidase family C39 domain-containing protein [Spirochaetota bacterium]